MSRGLPAKVKNLLDKSMESALLAVDIYNKPKTTFRSGGFIVLMSIAWLSLIHAIFEKNKIKYFYKEGKKYKRKDGDKLAWSLEDSIKEFFPDINPIRNNLLFFIKLRNKIEHRFMPEIDSEILSETQALILNFENILVSNFGEKYSLLDSLFIPLQLSESKRKIPISVDGIKMLDFIKHYRSSMSKDIQNSQEFAFKVFIIPNIGNHRNSADSSVQFIKLNDLNQEEMQKIDETIVAIRDIKIPIANAGKLRPKKVLNKIKDKTTIQKSQHWHTTMWKKYSVRPSANNCPEKCNIKYCQWEESSSVYIYTEDWVSFLIKKEKIEEEKICN